MDDSNSSSFGNGTMGETEVGPEEEKLKIIFYTFSFFLIGTICRQLVLIISMSFPYHVPLMLIGMFIGFISDVTGSRTLGDPFMVEELSASILTNLYLPVLMFDAAYNIEMDDAKILCIHVCLVVTPTIVTTMMAVSVVGDAFFYYKFTRIGYVLMMTVTLMPSPQASRSFTQSMGSSWMVRNLLEAEALIGNCIGFGVFEALLSEMIDMQSHHDVRLGLEHRIARQVARTMVSLFAGFVCGKLVISWISRIFKDHVNEICIIVAAYNGLYTFLIHIGQVPGFHAVVVLGLVLMSKRACMSHFTVQTLNGFNKIIIALFTSNLVMYSGIIIWKKIIRNIELYDIYASFVIFLVALFIRLFFLLVFYPIYHNYYLHDTRYISVMSVCNLRGAYSILMSIILWEVTKDSKLFTLSILQILISFVVNTPIATVFMERIGKAATGEKVLMIRRVANCMNYLRTSLIQSLKGTGFTADADWDVVVKQTLLKPDFTRLYKNRKYLIDAADYGYTGRDIVGEKMQMKEEAIRQLLSAQRANISCQSEEGVFSKEGVITLRYLINEALENKQLVDPSVIINRVQPNYVLEAIGNNMELLMKQRPYPVWFRRILYALFVLDASSTLSVFLYALTVHPYHEDTIIESMSLVNFGFFLIICIFIFKEKYSRRESLRPIRAMDYLDILILLCGVIDFFIIVIRHDHLHLWAGMYSAPMNAALVSTRWLKISKAVQFSPLCQNFIIRVVHQWMSHSAFINVDLCRGYALATLEAQKRKSTIAKDKEVERILNVFCKKSRLAMSQQLGLAQMENPGVMQALKTRNATRLILNGLVSCTNEIKDRALLGDMDLQLIKKEIESKIILTLNSPFEMPTRSDRNILRELPWLGGDKELEENLVDAGIVITFRPNDVIVSAGKASDGIYIMLYGMARMEWAVERDYTWKEDRDPQSQFLTPGHTIGELSFLTGLVSKRTCRCVTEVKAFRVTYDDMVYLNGCEPNPNKPMTPLEERMWWTIGVSRTVRILHSDVPHPDFTRSQMMYRMANSSIVDGNLIRVLNVKSEEKTVVLVNGRSLHYLSKQEYNGPRVIPPSVDKLITMPEKGNRVVFLLIKNAGSEWLTSSKFSALHKIETDDSVAMVRSLPSSLSEDVQDRNDDFSTAEGEMDTQQRWSTIINY